MQGAPTLASMRNRKDNIRPEPGFQASWKKDNRHGWIVRLWPVSDTRSVRVGQKIAVEVPVTKDDRGGSEPSREFERLRSINSQSIRHLKAERTRVFWARVVEIDGRAVLCERIDK